MSNAKDAVSELYDAVIAYVEQGDRVRAEDAISVASALTGEACLGAAGEIDVDRHKFEAGQLVFSDKVNEVLVGNEVEWDKLPESSIFGMFRNMVTDAGYSAFDLPDIAMLFRQFAASAGSRPGWAPLTVPEAHWPRRMTLGAARDLRLNVDAVCKRHGVAERHALCLGTTVKILAAVSKLIDPRIALTLSLETIVATAKTFPLTDAKKAEKIHAALRAEAAAKQAGTKKKRK